MGQQPSKAHKRLQEVRRLIDETRELMQSLRAPAARVAVRAEAAGIPVASGSDKALYDAAFVYLKLLNAEEFAITECIRE